MPFHVSVCLMRISLSHTWWKHTLNRIDEQCPKIKSSSELGQRFKTIPDKLDANNLDAWLEGAKQSEIKPLIEFAKAIKRDYDAVKAAFTYTWSNGQVEGQVN